MLLVNLGAKTREIMGDLRKSRVRSAYLLPFGKRHARKRRHADAADADEVD